MEPAPKYLQALGDEDLSGLLDHWLRLQLLGGELVFARVKHLLTGNAGQSQVGRVGLEPHQNLDRVRVHGAGWPSGARQAYRKKNSV